MKNSAWGMCTKLTMLLWNEKEKANTVGVKAEAEAKKNQKQRDVLKPICLKAQ